MQSDSEVQLAVIDELKWDTRVDETDIGVTVHSGVVTLTGTVSSWGKRVAAQEAAHRVKGVLDVANEIQVKVPGSARNDTEVAAAVRHALEWSVLVPDQRIRSTVSRGWVTLEGDVEYWTERHDAELAVRNLAGVAGLSNNIEVKPPVGLHNDVRRAVEAALQRQAEREARRVKVQVTEGKVTLSGQVHSSAERLAVLGAVRGTPGVRSVNDSIEIH